MSSYWAGYHGVGLVLTYEDVEGILEKYRFLNAEEAETIEDEYFDMSDYDFGWSASQDKVFEITELNTDYSDGFTFVPFKREDGSLNYWRQEKEMLLYNWREPSIFVIFADHSLDSARIFEKHPYPTYEDLKQEFQDKLKAYVPEDFNWEARIGTIDYACYG